MASTLARRTLLAGTAGLGAATLLPHATRAATSVNWLGWEGYDQPLKAGDFLASIDASLATTYINTNEEIITKLQAGGAGHIDLITIFYGHVPILVAADLLEPIDLARVPSAATIFPEFLGVEPIRSGGRLYALPLTWGTLSMVYDPAKTSKPASWTDCLKPEFKGKVALVDDATGLLATWGPIVTGTKTPTRITMDELKRTVDFLIGIKKNHARTLSSGYGEATDLFARGEVVTSAIGWDAMVGFAAAKNKKLAYAIPREGAMVFLDTIAIPKGAPNRDLAYKMIERSLSAAGQKVIADNLTQAVVNRAALPSLDAANRAIYAYSDLAHLFEQVHFYPFWPIEPEGDYVTHDQSQEEYQRFLKA